MYREIHPQDDNVLRQMTSTPLGEDLPESVSEGYWRFKQVADRVDLRPTLSDLAWICVGQGFYIPTAEELAPPTIVKLWRTKQLLLDAPVEVVWKKKKCTGAFKGVDAQNRVLVQIEGDADERSFEADKVKLLELATA